MLAAGAVNSAALLLASADARHPAGLANSSGQVGRNFMMHNNAHIVAVDLDRRNDVTFQKTLSVNDWYLDGGDGFPLGAMQLIGKVQGVMMKAAAPRGVPRAVLDRVAAPQRRVAGHGARTCPSPDSRVTVDGDGRITTARVARGVRTHRRLLARAKRAAAGRRLRRDPHAALRHQHEQPPVRDRRRAAPTRPRACSTRGAGRTTSRTSG